MITTDQLIEIGRLIKAHGVNGEIAATITPEIDIDRLKRLVVSIDGIFVPFYIDSIRQRGNESVLFGIDGINSEKEAKSMCNRAYYVLRDDDVIMHNDDDNDGFYASDLIGYTIVHADGVPVGTISDIEDSTENALFILDRPDGSQAFIPIVDDLIDDVDTGRRIIVMTLPEGLLDL